MSFKDWSIELATDVRLPRLSHRHVLALEQGSRSFCFTTGVARHKKPLETDRFYFLGIEWPVDDTTLNQASRMTVKSIVELVYVVTLRCNSQSFEDTLKRQQSC